MTLLWQSTQVRLTGEQLAPPAWASLLGPCLCCSSAAPRLSLTGLASKTSSSSWLPSLPCLLANTGVGVWTTGLDPLQDLVPSPGAAPGSLPIPTCQLTVLMSRSFSIAKLQIISPSFHHHCSNSPSLGSALHQCSALAPSLAENSTGSCREPPPGFSPTMLAISPLFSHLLP